jgi:lysophospholipase L1-like esterase
MATILTVGSSTTYGIGDPEGGWAGLLQSEMLARKAEELDARITGGPAPDKRGAFVHNLALVAGLTFPEIVESMPMYVRGLDREMGRKLVIAMVGSNDHVIPEGGDEPLVPLPVFERGLDRFGKLCAELGLISMFVEVCPIDPSRPRPYNRGDINPDRLGAYQQAVREHAQSVGARFIPTHEALKQLDQDPIGMDGIHPSPAANRKCSSLY